MSSDATAGRGVEPAHLQALVDGNGRSFRLTRVGTDRRRRLVATLAVSLIAVGAVIAVGGISVIASPAESDHLTIGLVALLAGLIIMWLSVHLHHRLPLVYLTDTQVRTRDELGFTWRMPRADVVSIDLGAAVLPQRRVASRVPYVRKSDGSRMWLTPLAGDAVNQPIAPAQLDVVRALRAALNVGGTDENPGPDADLATPVTRRRDTWRHRPRASTTIVTGCYVVFVAGMWTWIVATIIGRGVHEDDLRHSPGATVVTLRVDHVVDHCYKGCTYESVGSYRSPWSGRTVNDVSVLPNFQDPNHGPLRVVVSPGHLREALQAGYTGKGDIVFGIIVGATFSLFPLVAAGVLIHRLHRRLQLRRAVTAVAAGAIPTGRFRGILHGPGISPLIGMCRLELTPTSLVEVEKLIGGDNRWTIPLAEVFDVQYNAEVPIDAGASGTWRTTRFSTSKGTYTLTCDEAYLPLLREAFERRARAVDPSVLRWRGGS